MGTQLISWPDPGDVHIEVIFSLIQKLWGLSKKVVAHEMADKSAERVLCLIISADPTCSGPNKYGSLVQQCHYNFVLKLCSVLK